MMFGEQYKQNVHLCTSYPNILLQVILFIGTVFHYSKVLRLVCNLWMSVDWLHEFINYKLCPWSVYESINYEELYSALQRLLLRTAPE